MAKVSIQPVLETQSRRWPSKCLQLPLTEAILCAEYSRCLDASSEATEAPLLGMGKHERCLVIRDLYLPHGVLVGGGQPREGGWACSWQPS